MKFDTALERAIYILNSGHFYPHIEDRDVSFTLMKLRESIQRSRARQKSLVLAPKGKKNAKRSSKGRKTQA